MNSNNKPNKHSKTFYVEGMHCNACEMLIKQDISSLDGVSNVDVSQADSCAVVTADSQKKIPGLSELNAKFKDSGYKFYDSKASISKLSKQDFYLALSASIIFIILFIALERSGVTSKISLSGESGDFAFFSYFLFGLAAGISSCAALVGGLLLSLSKKWEKSLYPFILFNSARLIAFAVFGGILGFIGSAISISIGVTSFIAILIAIFMLFIGLQMLGVKGFKNISLNNFIKIPYLDKNQDFKGKYMPIIVGAATFFVPCGFTMIAQTTVLTSGSAISGAINLFAFALGTLPVLAIISFSSVKIYANQKFSRQFNIFAGALIVFFALYSLNSQLNVLGLKSLNDIKKSPVQSKQSTKTKTPSTSVVDDSKQSIEMEASGFEYFPKQFTIKSGLKTRWDIFENDAVGCAKAVYARGLYKDIIYLKPGMNSVSFIAPEPGTYKVSCSMGMVDPVYVKVI